MRTTATEKNEPKTVPGTSEQVTDFGNYDDAQYDDYEEKAGSTIRAAATTTASNTETTTAITVNSMFS